MSIKTKLIAAMIAVAFLGILGLGIPFYYVGSGNAEKAALENAQNSLNLVMDQMSNTVELSVQSYLKGITQKDMDIVKYYYNQYRQGAMTEQQAKEAVSRLLMTQKSRR